VDLGEKCKLGQADSYQVCHKWLKDRKGRALSLDEIRTYCCVITALARTIVIQTQIDALYPAIKQPIIKTQVQVK
jgi:hypothetical protein